MILGKQLIPFFELPAKLSSAKVPAVHFSIGEIELLSLSTIETLGDHAAWNYFQSLDSPETRVFVEKFVLDTGASG